MPKFLFIIFLLLSAVFIAYHQALNNGFVVTWDTGSYVVYNPHIKALTLENGKWMLTSFHGGNWMPLTWLSHAIDYALFELEPWGHHLVSIIIHGLNTVLLFLLMIVFVSFKSSTENASGLLARVENKTLLAAGIAALLFGIHPQHVESVVWVAERKDVLFLFFLLLAFLFYIFYTVALTVKGRFYWYLLALLSFILALTAKPMAMMFPVILLLMDVYPLNRTALTASVHVVSLKKLFVEKIPFFAFSLFSVIIAFLAQSHAETLSTVDEIGILIRILNAFNSLIFYISKFIFPVTLSPFYPFPSYQSIHEYYPSLIPVLACFLITLMCGYLWYKRKKYYWLIAWLFYLITLLPVLGIVKFGTHAAADRFVYLPTIPFYILLAVGIANLLFSAKITKILKWGIVIGVLLIGVVLIQLTQKQTLIWKNDLTFWGYIAAYAPDKGFPQFKLGYVYYLKGDYDKAIEHYHNAISLEPYHNFWYSQLPRAYIKSNKLQEALRLIDHLLEHNIDIGYRPDGLYYLKGLIYAEQGFLGKAQKALTMAVEINPNNNNARHLLLEITSNNPPIPPS